MGKDSNGNLFEDVANIRITYKSQITKTINKVCGPTDVLSFRAYKNADTDALHMGAEVVLKSEETILELIESLCRLYKNASKKTCP